MSQSLETKLDLLAAQGVRILDNDNVPMHKQLKTKGFVFENVEEGLDRRQTYLDEEIDVRRVCEGAVLYPGTRLMGARTFIGPAAKVGIEGPAVLENTVIGENAEVSPRRERDARNTRIAWPDQP